MKWPQFMSPKFRDLKKLDSYEEAAGVLKDEGINQVAEFFVESCDDKTWIQGGGIALMEPLFLWLSEAFFDERLDKNLAKQISQAIQKQYHSLESILPKDVDFVIEDQTIPVNPFMFAAQSPFFLELIRRTKPLRGRHRIPMQKIKLSFFDFIREFVTTAKIEYLWREEPKYIINYIRQSQKLGMDEMAAFASEVYKRYLTPQNVVPHLKLAEKESLKSLEQECCHFINEQNFGLVINFQEGVGLEVTLEHLLDRGFPILDYLKKQISFIVCKKSVAEDSRLVKLISSIRRLVGLDFSGTSGISPELLESFPSVKQLNLSDCAWLDDEMCLSIFHQSPGIVKLDLSKDVNLTFRTWGAMGSLTRLVHLNLSYCDQMDDDDFDLMASSCSRLGELVLRFTRISDKGLASVARNCQGLALLDLSDCRNLNGEGLIELGEYAVGLQVLDLTNCSQLNREFLKKFRKMQPGVREIKEP